jgi:predicted ATP-grasp superfamily ATP-dependent carboligase
MLHRRILVTDGDERAALAVVRSLGKVGHHVDVCSRTGRSIAGASRYCRRDWSLGSPLDAPDAFGEALVDLVRRRGVSMVLPVGEASVLATLAVRDRMPDVRIPYGPIETFRRICDKQALLAAAPEVGIAVPRQVVLATADERARMSPDALRFPVVIKPARSVVDGGAGAGRVKQHVAHAADAAELAQVLDDMGAEAYPLMLQERIVGPGVGVFVLRWAGRLLAVFSHRRLREKPPAGGVSAYRESIPPERTLVERSIALLDRFAWEGVAMVEYKVDAATGTPYLMEINGRFWGSLQLAIDAGVDFPRLLVAALDGTPLPPVTTYRHGVRSRWEWGDVDHLLARLRKSPRELALPPDAPGRWAVVRDFLRWSRLDRAEVMRLDDPLPFLRESAQWLRHLSPVRGASASSTSTPTTPATGTTPSASFASSPSSATSRSSA